MPPPTLTNPVAISGGQIHYLGLTAQGAVVGWGFDTYGDTVVPAGLTNVIAVAAGDVFSLALLAPTAVTLPATLITATSAVLNAIVPATMLTTTPVFEWGLTTNDSNYVFPDALPFGTGLVTISQTLTSLTPSTTYRYRIIAYNGQDVVHGVQVQNIGNTDGSEHG